MGLPLQKGRRTLMAKTSSDREVEAHAEVQRARAQPLQAVRPPARLSSASLPCAASASARTRIKGVVPGVTKASW